MENYKKYCTFAEQDISNQNNVVEIMNLLYSYEDIIDNPDVFFAESILYKFTQDKKAVVLVSYPENWDYIEIPAQISRDGILYDVIGIDDFAFEYLGFDFGEGYFSGFTDKQYITIPNTIKTIGSGAFKGRSNLVSINIPNSIEIIKNNAFERCISLESIYIPESVKYIGEKAFYECKSLNSIVVAEENTVYDSRYNCNAIIESSTKTLIVGCSNTIIPHDLLKIKQFAFSNKDKLTDVIIPETLTDIDINTFYSCDSIKSITIPSAMIKKLKTIFLNYESLISITISDRPECIHRGAFSQCKSLKSIVIPSSVTNIEEYAFAGCESLEFITIPNSVISIGNNAFDGCTSLVDVYIPSSVRQIGLNPFSSCSKLSSIRVDVDNEYYDSRCNSNAIIATESNVLISGCQNTIIPNDVITIGCYAFSGCEQLESIEIPTSVSEIYSEAFTGCEFLESIKLSSNITHVYNRVFKECYSLSSITYQGTKEQFLKIIDWYEIEQIPSLSIVHCLDTDIFIEFPEYEFVDEEYDIDDDYDEDFVIHENSYYDDIDSPLDAFDGDVDLYNEWRER